MDVVTTKWIAENAVVQDGTSFKIQFFIFDEQPTQICSNQYHIVSAVAELVKSKHVILKEKLRDSLCKYQVMLDNELYKAMKAMRDAQ